ncbi:hypothetical protein A0H81_05917 [Grifola frondosa]|uniref:Uncharacterized protein n=1 Tax=Grifola frondosa TaxID=5627 RepID=A0A1C7MAG0_GRIFR|nr:hypothetical protein A0H81_05917 [Grifola frondosa]
MHPRTIYLCFSGSKNDTSGTSNRWLLSGRMVFMTFLNSFYLSCYHLHGHTKATVTRTLPPAMFQPEFLAGPGRTGVIKLA